jgi:hypothetical protein
MTKVIRLGRHSRLCGIGLACDALSRFMVRAVQTPSSLPLLSSPSSRSSRSSRSLGGLLTLILAAGCAHSNVSLPTPDGYDRAYLGVRAEKDGCPRAAGPACCANTQGRLERAQADGNMADAAVALDLLAISCPQQRGNALAALGKVSQGRSGAAAPDPAAGLVSVKYAVDLAPTDRIYWIGQFVDGKEHARDFHAAGPHRLDVEVHVMTTGQAGNDHLYVVKGAKDVTVDKAGASVTVLLKRVGGAEGQPSFLLLFPDRWLSKEEAQAEAGTPPRLTINDANKARVVRGKLLDFGAARYPTELKSPGTQAMAIVCVDRAGRVETVSPLGTPHPRYVATLVDGLFQARYQPATIDGQPVPMCQPLRASFN